MRWKAYVCGMCRARRTRILIKNVNFWRHRARTPHRFSQLRDQVNSFSVFSSLFAFRAIKIRCRIPFNKCLYLFILLTVMIAHWQNAQVQTTHTTTISTLNFVIQRQRFSFDGIGMSPLCAGRWPTYK